MLHGIICVQGREAHDWEFVSQGSSSRCLTLGIYLTSVILSFLICSKSELGLMVLESR